MTLGIAMTLEDGVILVADGRQTFPMVSSKPPKGNVKKLKILQNNHIASISIGIGQATDVAIAQLKESLPNASGFGDISSQMDSSKRTGWDDIVSRLSSYVDSGDEKMKAALLVAGLFKNQPFIGGMIHYNNGEQSPILKRAKFNYLVLGGEKHDAKDRFGSHADITINKYETNPGNGVVNNMIKRLLKNAMETIRFLENQKNENNIRGVIRYAVIRQNFHFHYGAIY